MHKPTGRLAETFVGHINYLEFTRTKMELLLRAGSIVRRDIDLIYSGLFLEITRSLERLIEDLFVGMLVGGLKSSSFAIQPRVTFNSPVVAREDVLGGQNYVDRVPYNFTKRRARAFFRKGLPFTALKKSDSKKLENYYIIRNAIAHKSNYSNIKFEDDVIDITPLIPYEKIPSGYLRHVFRSAPDMTKYEEIVIEVAGMARKITCWKPS